MKGFIFAAGYGTRLKPITDNIPKPLIPVMGVPAICYSLLLLKEAGITELVINLHHKYEQIINFFNDNDNFGFNINFSIEKNILGTGGGLKNCESLLINDDFIILNSDIITDINLIELINYYHNSQKTSLAVITHKSNDPTVTIYDDLIIDFKNFLKSNTTAEYDYAGIAITAPAIFNHLKKNFSSIVYTAYTYLAPEGELGHYLHNGLWYDIGAIDSYKNTNEELYQNENSLRERLENILAMEFDFQMYQDFIRKYNL